MEGVAVDLDDEAVLAPEEVDFVAVELRVGLRGGQLSSADQLQRAALRFGSGECRVGPDRFSQCSGSSVPWVTAELLIEGPVRDEVVDAGFVRGSVEVACGGVGGQVEEGAGG